MVGFATAVVWVALVLAGAVLCGAAVVARRRRSAPAADEFAVVAGLAGVGALAVAGNVLAGPGTTVLAAVTVGLVLPLPWLVFAFEYTGRSRFRSHRVVAVVATPVALGVVSTVLIFGSRLTPWLSLPSRETATGPVAVAVYSLTIAEWITLLYAGGLMLVGTGVLLWTFHRYDHLDSTSGTLLGIFGSVPWLSLLFGFQVSSVAPLALPAAIAVGFLVGGAAVVVILRRRQLFRTLPAAGNIGPATVVEELSDVVVVTDSDGTVVERNAAARRLPAASTAEGGNVADLLDTGLSELGATDAVELRTAEGRRLFEPTVSELTDQHGLRLGHAVVLRDVTDRAIRRQRLEVFNRVLRHNLSNDTTVIQGRAGLLADGIDDADLREHVETIDETSRELAGLSEAARETERLLASAERTPEDVVLADLVRDVLATASAGTDCEHDVPAELVVRASRDLLRTALSALVENAVEHNDADEPTVAVRARHEPGEPYPVVVTVADNGPGIPDVERETVLEGDETPLRHGSGLGLWLVRWAVTLLGGTLAIDDNDPRGAVVSVRLPNGRLADPTAGE